MYGYAGKVLIANLSNQTYEVRDLDPEWARLYMGGSALGARFLYDLMPAHTDAFSEDSVVGFVGGPTNATRALMGGRFTVCSKSPITGGLNDCNGGGNFGPFMRKAGFDAIFVKGISEKPVYLYVDDGKVSFCDASNVWGKTCSEATDLIMSEIGQTANVGMAIIGPAGENLSRMAAIMSDKFRAAARGGSGAVIGSKKLKGVVCHGTGNIEVADNNLIMELNKKAAEHKKVFPPCQFFPVVGTSNGYGDSVVTADCSIKNWAGDPSMLTEDEINRLNGSSTDPLYKVGRYACHNCYIGCGAKYHVVDEELGLDFEGYRPEYETIGVFGANLLNTNAACMLACNWYCNEYGIDTLSMGGTLGWAMECYEKGILTKDDLDGIELKWGDPKAILAMMEKVCKNEGIGAVLLKGSKAAADELGKGHECLVLASGHELAMHGSRLNPAMARTFQYDPTPGRHTRAGRGVPFKHAPDEARYNFDGDEFGAKEAASLWEWESCNASGFCAFSQFLLPPGPPTHMAYIKGITGVEYDMPSFITFGQRCYTVRLAFNLREGMRRKDYKLSGRATGHPPLKAGPLTDVVVDNEKIADRFFEAMGFDKETGVPSIETLKRLEMDYLIPDLYPEA